MQLEDLTKIPHQSYKLPNSFFNIVNFTPIISFINNLCVKKVSDLKCDLNQLFNSYRFKDLSGEGKNRQGRHTTHRKSRGGAKNGTRHSIP